MKNILSQELSSASFILIFKCAIIAFISLSFYNIFISPYCLIDTVEHIHASYLINIGLIPYRDFFEHHNPLLWYILSPLTQLLYNDINIIHIARFIACCFHLVNLFLFYKIIEKFLYNKNIARTSILIFLSIPYIWRDITVLRPDIFMYTTFLAALYFLFTYFNKKKTIYLILSYSLLFPI